VATYPPRGIWVHQGREHDFKTNVFDDADMGTEYGDHLDPFNDLQQQLFDTFDLGDHLCEETLHIFEDQAPTDDIANETVEDTVDMDALYREGTRPIYHGSSVSTISATIVLINMAVIHSVINAYVDELLKYLSTVLLPEENTLPKSHYEAKKLICKLGLQYNVIHTCPNKCVLYRGDYENLDTYLELGCGLSRFILRSQSIPARVIRHFPLIPRLLHMFRSPAISRLLTFYSDNPNIDNGVMKSVADSPTWKHIDTDIDVSFGQEPWNLRLAMSLDGINLFPHTNSTHSTWPVLMFLYNLPPHLVTKKFFIQLCILISGKLSPTNENIDVFIRPLLEELQQLWDGVRVQDFSKPHGERRFTLRAIPGYGLISGLCTYGYKGCTICGPCTESRTALSGNKVNADNIAKGRKTVYMGGRRWMHRHHPYQRNLDFNEKVESRLPPTPMTGEETTNCGMERQRYLASGGQENGPNDPVHQHGVKRWSCLDELPYWRVRNLTSF
jgi:hypothetical protein